MNKDIKDITFSCAKIKATDKQIDYINELLNDLECFEDKDYLYNIISNQHKYTKKEASSIINDLRARREFYFNGEEHEENEPWYYPDCY